MAITLQVNVSPETPDGEEFDVGSGIGNTFDVLEQLLIRAPTTTTSTTTTTTTPVSTTATTAPAAADPDEARLSPTG